MADLTLKGGEQLEKRLAEIAAKLSTAATLRVGFLEGSTEADGTSVPMLAAVHNYGSAARGIPPRPFFSNMVSENQDGWPAIIEEGLKRSDMDARGALTFAGQILKEQLQAAIVEGEFAPLKPKTIERKGFATPLIDTATMLNSADFEVD
jgi:hypothetical protein